jgi:hypothetical protein
MVSIHVDGDYKGSASIELLQGRSFVPSIDKLAPGTIVRARVDGAKALYRVGEANERSVHLVSADEGLGKFYLAGPMRGIKFRNYPAFLFAASVLRKQGFKIISPAENDLSRGVDPKNTGNTNVSDALDLAGLAYDFEAICKSDGIILMEGWEPSTGAAAEFFVARMTGKQVLWLDADMELRIEEGWQHELTWSKS